MTSPSFPSRLLAALFLLSSSVSAEDRPVYDLGRCSREALSRNPSLTIAQSDVEIADARRRAATASLLTAVTLKAAETRGKAEAAQTPSFVERSYGVQASQPLFSGGRLTASRRQASLGADISRFQLEKQRLDVLAAVADAYWRLVAAEAGLKALKEAYAALQEDLEKAVRHELGGSRSARIELLSTRLQNRECEAAVSEEEESRLQARTALLDAMGERRSAPFDVPLDLPLAKVDMPEAEVLRLVRDHRPELKISERLYESARMARLIGRSAYYPRVDLNGFYGRSGAAFVETDPFVYRKDWNAGVSVSWPLFGSTAKYSGFRERTSPKLGESTRTETESQTLSLSLGDALSVGVDARQSRRNYMEEEWRFEKARRDVDQEALLALQRVRTAWSRASAAVARAEEAEQQLKETRSLLQDDRAHLGDLAAARLRAAQAQAASAKARAHYRISLSALNRAVGVADYFDKK